MGSFLFHIWLLSILGLSLQDDGSLTLVGNGCCRGGSITVLKEINSPGTTLELCQRACLANPLCVAMDFARGNDCFLWTGTSSQGVINSCTTSDTKSWCYVKPLASNVLPPPPAHAWILDTDTAGLIQYGVDRGGSDLSGMPKTLPSSDIAMCARMCELEPQCQAYTMAHPDCNQGNLCWLKSAIVTPSQTNCRITGVKADPQKPTSCTSSAGGSRICVADGKVWVRIFRCQSNNYQLESNVDQIKDLAKRASQVRIYSPDGRFVESRPNTFPIRNLRDGKSCSHPPGGYATTDVVSKTWHGDPDLLKRMWNSCSTPVDLNGVFYHACNNAEGLHLVANDMCEWQFNGRVYKEISIWIDGGFDFPDKGTKATNVATGFNVKNLANTEAVIFQGHSDSYVNLGLTASKAFSSSSFSLSFWSQKTSSANNAVLFSDRVTGSHGQFFNLRQWPNTIYLEMDYNGSPYLSLNNNINHNDGKWHHVCVVVDSNNGIFLYIDGSLAVKVGYQNVPLGNAYNLFLGREPNSPDYGQFDGSIAAVQIYDVPLTASQVSTLWNTQGEESVCSSGYTLNSDRTQCLPISPVGVYGPVGPAGPAGKQGTAGMTGADGVIGATGYQGAQGPAGATGPKGERGDPGDAGAAGKVGPTGATGIPGKTGDAGLPGIPGSVAPDDFPVVTGPPGVTGATGVTGFIGPGGVVGPTGPNGPKGYPGLTGDTGVAGVTGVLGAAGAQGPKGAQGAAGIKGEKGAPGAVGDTGVIGPTGAIGATGYPGAPGANGATGLDGAVGTTGVPGGTGSSPDGQALQDALLQAVSNDIKNRVLDDTPKAKEYDSYDDDEFQKKVKYKTDEVIKKKILLAVREELDHLGVSHSLTRLRDEIWALKRRVAYSESLDGDLSNYRDVVTPYEGERGLLESETYPNNTEKTHETYSQNEAEKDSAHVSPQQHYLEPKV